MDIIALGAFALRAIFNERGIIIMAYDYEYFKKEVFALTKIDLNAYKEKQMKRRIDTLISKHKVVGYDKFVAKLRDDRAVFDDFVNYLTINVSEFYRNPDQWRLMDKEIIPELISKFGKNLKIWSAACSTGDEPYSLVMAFSKFIPLNQINIIATDIDKQVIEKAKLGLYSEKSIASVPDEFKKKYFTKVGPSYQISNEIKSRVQFKFNASLKSEGVLFIGSTEQIMNYKDLNYERKNSFFYLRAKQ